jgi:hypothetical protein
MDAAAWGLAKAITHQQQRQPAVAKREVDPDEIEDIVKVQQPSSIRVIIE